MEKFGENRVSGATHKKSMNTLIAIIFVAVLTIFTAIVPETAEAASKTSAESAKLANIQQNTQEVVEDTRAAKLRAYLESYNSPLAAHAETFISEADKHNIDWRLVPAITGVESYFGQMIPPYSYNGWGYGVYGNNVKRFASWDEGISVVTQALRVDYMDSWGATTVAEIGSFYAADPRWSAKVQHFINDLEQFTVKPDKTTLSISL